MKGYKLRVPGFFIAAWVMTSIVIAVACGLCLGAAEAIAAHDHNTTQRT